MGYGDGLYGAGLYDDALTATVQGVRVMLVLYRSGIQTTTVTRLDPDGVWRPVRSTNGDDLQVCISSCAFFDHEAPLDGPLTYQSTSAQASGAYVSNTVTVSSGGQAWLTHPGHPQYAGVAVVTPDGLTESRPARRGVFSPIGMSLPVVVNDVRSGSTGTVVVQTNSAADVARLRNMLADGAPLLLRQPALWGGDSWWVSIGDVGIDRFTRIATDNWRHWTLPYLRVDRPPGATDGAVGVTYNDLKATYANYNALLATGFTYTRVAQSIT